VTRNFNGTNRNGLFSRHRIVGDVHQYGLDRAADPAVYLLFNQLKLAPQGWASLVVRSGVPSERIESGVRAAMRDIDPLEPVFHLRPMTTYLALSVSQRTFALLLIAATGALALATGGVYGVVSYVVERRTREVGLRLALGASAASVRRLIAGQVLLVALISIVCGVAICGALGRALSSLLFGIGSLIAGITLAASAVPLWRASRIDPLIALKTD
jgi:hypothetical protein